MKILTGLIILYGVGDEHLGYRNLACVGTEVGAKFRSQGTEDAADTLIQEREWGFGSRSAPLACFSGTSELPHQRADWLAAFFRLKSDRSLPNHGIETLPWLYSRVLLLKEGHNCIYN